MGAHDHVLEDLVERRAEMDVAVRIGRPVVQDEGLAALGCLPQALVEAHRLPALQEKRLALGQAGAHREVCLRQVERLGIVARGSLRLHRVGHGKALWQRAPQREPHVTASGEVRPGPGSPRERSGRAGNSPYVTDREQHGPRSSSEARRAEAVQASLRSRRRLILCTFAFDTSQPAHRSRQVVLHAEQRFAQAN